MRKKQLSYFSLCCLALLSAGLLLTKCTKKGEAAQPAASTENPPALKTQATAFVHPGILNTQASLAYIANEVNNNTNPDRVAAYNLVTNYCDTHSPSNGYKATITVASSAGTQDETNFKGDALLSYALALRWAKTGNSAYATTVKQMLDGWANAFQNIVVGGTNPNPNQGALEASWATPTFCAAAEIIKYYHLPNGQTGGWTTAEDNQFKVFINKLKDNYINNTPNYNNNWNVSQGYAKMAIGIFEDSQTVYDNGLTIIKNMLPLVIASDGSMNGEICGSHNDYVHFQYSLTGFTYAANLAVIQFGDQSVYDGSSSRLLTGYNYQYKLIKGTVFPPCSPSGSPSNPIWPGIEIADRHWHTTETGYIRNLQDPYGLPGGDVGFLGWTSYTHHNVP
ncbi:alginate lyase family protein [Mucilaginibacter boryungensis]|uniref:Alginate lyase family protein n=1 Tax=Mucilaginibacter boryungensis TaxID=768480 RepID=A0ABR9XFL6_9SPHI|nr:alginate lyase family protein [Mucilaginibacter boryungensis]MBE9665818.1 alginate lyase family protein [Mucilaginibacter boryungensis]